MGGKSSKTEDSGESAGEATSEAPPEKGKFGEPSKYDPTFNGPIKNRSCTDIICCILFIICFVGMLAVACWAYVHGDPATLLYPTDSQGNLCGSGDYEDRPNLFFFDLTECAMVGAAIISSGCPTTQVCVATCPTKDWVYLSEGTDVFETPVPSSVNLNNLYCTYATTAALEAGTTSEICVSECPTKAWTWISQEYQESINPASIANRARDMFCRYDIDPVNTTQSLQDLVSNEECASYYLESEPLVGRCIPAAITQLAESLTDINGTTLVNSFGSAINGTVLEDADWLLFLLNVENYGRLILSDVWAMYKATLFWLLYLLNAQSYGSQILADIEASWWLMLVWLVYLLNVQNYGSQVVNDLARSWFMMLIMLAISMVVSFIWIILMRWIAGPIIWITLFLFLGLFSFGTYYCFDKYVDLTQTGSNATQVDSITDLELTTDLDYWANLTYTWLALGIIAALFLLIVLIILIFLRNRIRIAIALIGESSRAVGCMMFTLLWPIWPFIMEVILFGFWGASAIYLASAGSAQYGLSNSNVTEYNSSITLANGTTVFQEGYQTVVDALTTICDPNANGTEGSVCSFIAFGGDEYTIYMQFFQLFMLFWCMNFIIALGQMTLAGAFASYYWAFNKPKDIPTFPLLFSFGRCFRYHLGSLAFGSLIIAIIQIIRVFLEYLDHKLKGKENAVARFILTCLKCFFWCLEKFMKFINKNAYILIAVYGKNFCTSAKNAFFLIMRNIVRVVVIDKVTDFLLFIGKLVVVAVVGALAFFFFSGDLASAIPWDSISIYVSSYTPTLNFYLVPVIIVIIGTYIIAAAFFSVYSMAVDTLFLCFLEDLERHDGSAEKPYYMSKGLMDILGKKNKPPPGASKEDK